MAKPTVAKGSGEPRRSKPAPSLAAGLYVVATPIGNLGDVTLRALEVLARADVIACEDTRVTAKLLARHAIKNRTTRYDDHNSSRATPGLVARMSEGQAVALVSDAGTPLISDPGGRLVRAAIDAGLPVFPIPGASSVLAALSGAGLPTGRFLFAGFLPPRKSARLRELETLADSEATLVFLESPRRLAAALADMAQILGPRSATVARELTKRFEEFRRDTLSALAAHYADQGAPKGEVVIAVAGPGPKPPPKDAALKSQLATALKTASLRQAVASVAAQTGLPRRKVYAMALELTGK